jgi:phosphatidylglycerophosphate synthase
VSTLLNEYRRSLKLARAEEFADLALYRPLAFGLVKLLYRLPITPNQVTAASLIAGVAAGWKFSVGSKEALVTGALLYALANILDCADGQLARIQNSGSPLGRLVDGVVDYIVSVAVFVGIGIGLAPANSGLWWLVVVAGVSSAAQAIRFDQVQGDFISAARGEHGYMQKEQEKSLEQLKAMDGSRIRRTILSVYRKYLGFQNTSGGSWARAGVPPTVYEANNRLLIRFWTLLGPTTNRSILILCALTGNLELFLWIVVLPANIWLGTCTMIQRSVDKRMLPNPSLKTI